MIRRLPALAGAALILSSAALTPSLAAPARAAVSLTGAGSTFDLPLFDKAFTEYQKSHSVSINYQAIGSGAGIQQFTAKTVDFGATDVPMNPISELPPAVKAGGPVLQIPITLGGVSVAYNLPGIKSGLRLDGSTLAGVFLGQIKQWNDRHIKQLNPKLKLPNMPITVAHRSDGSGTSYIFTDYLAKVSDVWRGNIGVGKLPNWPAGVGGKGNPGVAAIVQQTPGAIGYVELAYVVQNKMTQAAIKNRSGQFVIPTARSVAADAATFPKVSATSFSIVNGKGKNSYPIAGYSWILLYKKQSDSAKGKALSQLSSWMLQGGQKYAPGLDYVPLPHTVVKLGLSVVKSMKM